MAYRPPETFARDMAGALRRVDATLDLISAQIDRAYLLIHPDPERFPKMSARHAELRVGESVLKLAFDFRALAEAGALAEKRHVGLVIIEAGEASDMVLLCKLAALALRRHHPDLTADWLMDQSPVAEQLVAALLDAFSLAWRGKRVAEHLAELRAAAA